MPSKPLFLALLALVGCDRAPEAFQGLPCESEPWSGEEVSYEHDSLVCVSLEMVPEDFEALTEQYRFDGDADDQWPGVIAATALSCSQPYPDNYTYFPADVSVDGVEVQDVAVRKKGFIGSQAYAGMRPSFKVKLDEYIDDQAIGETDSLTLNNNLQDHSRMRTCLAYQVFEDAGYPAPRCNLASVSMNGTWLGAYTHVESPKKEDFLRRAFGNTDGSLYEGTLADFTDAHLAGLPSNLGRFEIKTDDTDPSGALLRGVADALKAPDGRLEEELAEVIDLDAFFLFWALETLVNHDDGYAENTNNFYLYFDPDRGDRAVFVPWGVDETFYGGRPKMVTSELTRRLSRHPELGPRYLAELDRLLTEVWEEDQMHTRIDQFSAQVRSAEVDLEGHEWSTGQLHDWVDGRRATLRRFVDGGGNEGEADTRTCTGNRNTEDFLLVSELATVASMGCATVPHGPLALWLAPFLLLARRVRPD